MSYQKLFDQLWKGYIRRNPNAHNIYNLLEDAGERVINDHIALRTFDDKRVNIDFLSRAFIDVGYELGGEYDFPAKKLNARHYQHKTDKDAPKVFISEIRSAQLKEETQKIIKEAVDSIPKNLLTDPVKLLFSDRPWSPISYNTYKKILDESEFAAWLLAYGYGANHFTVSVNHLKKFNTLQKLNEFIISNGYELNQVGGEIKGSPEVYFEQSSTMAELQPIEFADGSHRVASCYYEFARRYVQPDGSLFNGFITSSADKLFESTNI